LKSKGGTHASKSVMWKWVKPSVAKASDHAGVKACHFSKSLTEKELSDLNRL